MEIEHWNHALSYKAVPIPIELRLAVLGYVEKKELKQLRLVSKEWHAIATTPLFDKIYISPHEKDLETWYHIINHPVLREAVKELVYDTSEFRQNINYELYYEEIFYRTWDLARRCRQEAFNSPDAQLNSLIEECKRAMTMPNMNDMNEIATIAMAHRHDTFVNEGYQIYIANAAYEQRSVQSGEHYLNLYWGLQVLSQLRTVSIGYDHWDPSFSAARDSDLLARRNPARGSPLSRMWDPLHLEPESPARYGNHNFQPCYHFARVTEALTEARRPPTSFGLRMGKQYAGLPPLALSVPKALDAAMTAHGDLEDYPLDSEAPIGFPKLLSSMHQLKQLNLTLNREVKPGRKLHFRYDLLFPAGMIWPTMSQQALRGGTWQGVIEGLRLNRLTQFSSTGGFTLRGDPAFQAPVLAGDNNREGDDYEFNFYSTIENYVINGGRHPFLAPKDHSETAICYLYDLFPNNVGNRMKAHARHLESLNVKDLLGLISETDEF